MFSLSEIVYNNDCTSVVTPSAQPSPKSGGEKSRYDSGDHGLGSDSSLLKNSPRHRFLEYTLGKDPKCQFTPSAASLAKDNRRKQDTGRIIVEKMSGERQKGCRLLPPA